MFQFELGQNQDYQMQERTVCARQLHFFQDQLNRVAFMEMANASQLKFVL